MISVQVFIVLDMVLMLATIIVSIFPSSSCLYSLSDGGKCQSNITEINVDSNNCKIYPRGSLYFEQMVGGYYACKCVPYIILTLISNKYLCKCRPSINFVSTLMFYLRILPSALILPPFGVLLVHYVTITHSKNEADLDDPRCAFVLPSTWWAASILFLVMVLTFVAETIAFTATPSKYLDRRHWEKELRKFDNEKRMQFELDNFKI